MVETHLPLPVERRELLLRGPLILTAISRVLMIPFYFICAVGSSNELKMFYHHLSGYRGEYIVDKVALAVALWAFLLLSVLLAALFFTRHRMFRPLMIYFSLLPPLLLVGVVMHTEHFKPRHHHAHAPDDPYAVWMGLGIVFAVVIWPFYYGFSSRMKRVFTR